MSDVRSRFQCLADDVTGSPPPAAEVRRAAERRRVAHRILTTCLAALLVSGLLVAQALTRDEGEPEIATVVGPSPEATSTAVRSKPWLGDPWVLKDVTTASSYRFCGQALQHGSVVRVTTQVFTGPSGRDARLSTLEPQDGDAFNLFKFSYASCLVPGDAVSVAGPRNLWSYAGSVAGSEVVGVTLHVAELTGGDVEQVLDAWVRT